MNGADPMICMYSSSSSTANPTLNVLFEIGANPELTQADVQNRVCLVLPRTPRQVESQGIQVQKKSSAFIAAQVPQ
ncbi:Multidrug export protein AcrF [Paraburkholderia hiiakae]|uniref:Multidrug export protein AcrF n=1 Tax=Paraburkholderia hiiakae TaxID=1081782 RepID=A0ABN7HJG2_9BURK|nr:Multidrug export protein AcrF [Paraburkholderia hiiakae]